MVAADNRKPLKAHEMAHQETAHERPADHRGQNPLANDFILRVSTHIEDQRPTHLVYLENLQFMALAAKTIDSASTSCATPHLMMLIIHYYTKRTSCQ